jgi:hypothetical protein
MATLTEILISLGVDPSDIDKGIGEGQKKVEKGTGLMVDTATVAAAAIGGALATGIATALDLSSMQNKVAAALDLSSEESARVGAVAGELFGQGFSDNVEDVNTAIQSVIQNMDGMRSASEQDLESISGKVLNVASVFDKDFNEVTRAAGQLMKTGLAKDATEALDLVTEGFQDGLDSSGDFLDTLNEYAPQFESLGLTGAQSIGLIEQSMAAGAFNTDKAADALKEFNLRATDPASADAFRALGLNAEDMFQAFAAGGPGAATALDQVLDGIRNTKDPLAQAQIATALFGTQFEDLQSTLLAMDVTTATDALGEFSGEATKMGEGLENGPNKRIQAFWNSLQLVLAETLGNVVIPIITTAADIITTVLGPAMGWLGDVISNQVVPAFMAVAQWASENKTWLMIIGGLLLTFFIPAIVAWGVQTTISAAKSVAAWATTAAKAIWSSVVQVASMWQVIGSWVAGAISATVNAAKIVAGWVAAKIQAGISAAAQVAAWVAIQAKAVWATAIVIAQWVAQRAAAVANMAITVATVVAGWVMMGIQSLLGAAKMALAWIIAMGPVAIVIAIIIGLVALIIVFWDEIKEWTIGIFTAIWDFLVGIWNGVVDIFKGVINWVKENWPLLLAIITGPFGLAIYFIIKFKDDIINAVKTAIDWVVDKFGDLVNFVKSLPGKIGKAASGMWDGIKNAFKGAVNWLIDAWNNFELTIGGGEVLGVDIPSITLSTPNIPRLAKGGIAKAQPGGILANIAEGGQDEVVAPLPQLARIMSHMMDSHDSSGPKTVIENLNVTTLERGYPTWEGLETELELRGFA